MPPVRHSLFARLAAVCLALLLLAGVANPTAGAATPPRTTDQIMTEARTTAAAEHKHILAVFSASWCGPCHLFEGFLDDPQIQPIVQKQFVIVRLDVGERADDARHANTPGAEDLRTTLAGPNPGFPYIAMLDASGKPVADSLRPVANHPGGENIGYPDLPVEIDWFMQMLRKAAPDLSAKDADTVRNWLRSHSHSA